MPSKSNKNKKQSSDSKDKKERKQKRFVLNGVTYTRKQYLFAKAYIELDFNGTMAAVEAFDIDQEKGWYNTASVMANENLRKPKIVALINHLGGFTKITPEVIEQEMAYLVVQREDNNAKCRALDMKFKIDGAYKKDNEQRKPDIIIETVSYGKPKSNQDSA